LPVLPEQRASDGNSLRLLHFSIATAKPYARYTSDATSKTSLNERIGCASLMLLTCMREEAAVYFLRDKQTMFGFA
jgi:hypothetical protein